MSLEKQTVPVAFTSGMDTKSATQTVMPGSFLLIENGIRRKDKLISKRFGFDALSRMITADGTITTGRKIDHFKDDLVLLDNESLYSYISTDDQWVNRGKIPTVLVDSQSIIRNSDTQAQPDSSTLSGLTCNVWEDSRGGVRYSISSEDTGATIVNDAVLSATGDRPKVIVLGNRFILVYYEGNTGKLTSRYINTVTPTLISSPQAIITTNNTAWDLEEYGTTSAIFVTNTGSVMNVGYIDGLGQLGSPGLNGLPNPTTIATPGQNCATIVPDITNGYIYCIYSDASYSQLVITGLTANLVTQHSQVIETGQIFRNATGIVQSDNSILVYSEVIGAPTSVGSVYTQVLTYNGATFTLTLPSYTPFKYTVGLSSKIFASGLHKYVALSHESELQNTYFVVRDDGLIVARIETGTGGGLTRNASGTLESGLPRVRLDSTGRFIFGVQVANKLVADNDGHIISENRGLNKIGLSIDKSALNSDELGLNYHIAGGALTIYDSARTVESGFHLYPENISPVNGGTGSVVTGGTYLIRVTYEWVDAKGQIHRSVPSIPVSITVGANDIINVTCPSLLMTSKPNVKVVVYRTVAGGTIYYRDVVADNSNITTQLISLVQSDDTLATKEILYTTGGTLENTPPPSCKIVRKHKNRLFLAGLEDPNSIAYSRLQQFGEGVEFSDGLVFSVDPLGGDITALSSLDDKLIIFKPNRIFVMGGDGPLDTGAQNDYPNPQLVSGDVGCELPNSIAIMPQGIMFKSAKGIYLLNRSLTLQYIGAPVEAYNNLTVTSAVFIENANEVRFTTSDGETLVYNHFFGQWSVFTNYEAVSATISLGRYLHLKSDGQVYRETADAYLDNGVTYNIIIETGWFSFAGIQSFQRIYRYALLGDFITHCTTRVKLAYNFEPVYNETVLFNSQTGLMQSTYGDDVTYGSGSPYGGSGSLVYQFRSKPARQKCEAIKMRIEILDNLVPTGGASVALTNLAFDVGIKGGINRMGGGKNVGSL